MVSYRRSAIDDEDLTNLVLTPGGARGQSPQFVPAVIPLRIRLPRDAGI